MSKTYTISVTLECDEDMVHHGVRAALYKHFGGHVVSVDTNQSAGQDNKRLSSGRVREAIDALSARDKAILYADLSEAWTECTDSLQPQENAVEHISAGRTDRT